MTYSLFPASSLFSPSSISNLFSSGFDSAALCWRRSLFPLHVLCLLSSWPFFAVAVPVCISHMLESRVTSLFQKAKMSSKPGRAVICPNIGRDEILVYRCLHLYRCATPPFFLRHLQAASEIICIWIIGNMMFMLCLLNMQALLCRFGPLFNSQL